MASAVFPILIVSAIGCLVVVVLQQSKTEQELKEAKQAYSAAIEKIQLSTKELRDTTELIQDLQRQIDNVKAAQNMNIGRRT